MSNGSLPEISDTFVPRRRTLSSPSPTTPTQRANNRTNIVSDADFDISAMRKEQHHSTRRPQSRVIRTFEEIEVEKLVMTEEWYEELECGICSHVLAAPHALVPCGHTFCGICALQWIRANKNQTCPACRMEVLESTPYVPNIIVDQIIERKLSALPQGPKKMDMLLERQEKTIAWKHHLATILPPKPPLPPRRPRGLDDIMMNLLDYTAPSNRSDGHRRRASRHFAELGPPLIHAPQPRSQAHLHSHPYGDRNIDNIWGGRIDEEVESLANPRLEMRRTRENLLREHMGALTSLPEESETDVPVRRERDFRPMGRIYSGGPRPLPLPSALSPSGGTSAMQRSTPSFQLATTTASSAADLPAPSPPPARSTAQTPGFVVLGRPTPLRTTILAARQARGRSNGSGSRDHPLVVLTDSD